MFRFKDWTDSKTEIQFSLKFTTKTGSGCSKCNTISCSGCRLENSHTPVKFPSNERVCFVAIDWDQQYIKSMNGKPEQLKKMYQPEAEEGEKTQKKISIDDCLKLFTQEEQLGPDDPWYCTKCKKHQQGRYSILAISKISIFLQN